VERLTIAEKSLIRRIRGMLGGAPPVVTGVGDDCAVLRIPAGHEILVTTDFTLENVHFRKAWHPPEVVGRRCLTRGLSDIAAMGGLPLACFLSLALVSTTPRSWIDRFLKGLLALAREFRIPLAGGDTAQSTAGIEADIVVVGAVPKGKAVLRSHARPGDAIYVSGELGGSAAAVLAMKTSKVLTADYTRHFHPTPRVSLGAWLRKRNLASAMIDLSDGLSTDLGHICEESGVGAEIESAAIPGAQVGRPPVRVDLDLSLHGGEDYELLFTSSERIPKSVAGVNVTRIGRITGRSGMFLIRGDGRRKKLLARGWEHFRNNP
jgi:thiamine-monophosphate kinase